MRVHLVNPSDVSFGMAIITPRWLYVLAAATPPMWGNPVLTDETLEVFDPAQVDVVGIGIHKPTPCAATRLAGSHASKGHTLSTAVFTRHSTQTRPTSWAERTPSSVVMGIRRGPRWSRRAPRGNQSESMRQGASRRLVCGRPGGTSCREIVICGHRCRQFAAVRNTARSAPCGAPMVRSRVNELLTS